MIDVELIGAPSFAVTVAGGDFSYVAVNTQLAELLGIPAGDVVGRTPHAVLPPTLADTMVARCGTSVAERRSIEFETFHDGPGGGRWWQVTLTPMLDGVEGEVAMLLGVAVDVTQRRAAERRNREVDARVSLAMDVLDGGFWHYSIAEGRFRTSPQLTRLLTGDDDDPLDGERYTSFVLDEDRGAVDLAGMIKGEGDAAAAEYRVRTLSGEVKWVFCKRRLTRDDAGRPENIIGVVVDITEQKLRRDSFARQASTDLLTDLLNRRGFEDLGRHLVARSHSTGRVFGLILLDLDRFKPVNDNHGHAVGDAVLREVAARLRRYTRAGDAAVRLGGDEFALLVEDATRERLSGLAARLVEVMSRPVVTPVGRIEIGASVGAALWGPADPDLTALAVRADEALLGVKREGRGSWCLAP